MAGVKGEGQSQPQPCEVLEGAMSNTKVRIVHIRLLHYLYTCAIILVTYICTIILVTCIILHIVVILYNLLQ